MSGRAPGAGSEWRTGTAEDEDLAFLSEADAAMVDELVEECRGGPGALGAVLVRLNELLGCVSPQIQEAVARRLAVPSVIVQQVVSFDPDLSPRSLPGPPVRLCGGAACLAPHGLGVHQAVKAEAAVFPCLGACWGAPVAEAGSLRFEKLTPVAARDVGAESGPLTVRRRRPLLRGAPASLWRREDLRRIREHLGERMSGRAHAAPHLPVREVLVCNGSGCSVQAADRVAEVISRTLAERGVDRRLRVVRVGCRGEDLGRVTVTASPTGWRVRGVDEVRAAAIVSALCRDQKFVPDDAVWFEESSASALGVLQRCGVVDPCSLEEYIASGGFSALEQVLAAANGPAWALARIEQAGLSVRGEGGRPLGCAMAAARSRGTVAVLCPCVSTDAYLAADSLLVGGDPFAVVEGVILTGLLCGAPVGVIMPPAGTLHLIEKVELAVALARRRGLLGSSILGGDFSFEIAVVPAPRSLVATDESALRRYVVGAGPLTPAPRALIAGLPESLIIDPESAARLCGVIGMKEGDARKEQELAGLRLVTLSGRAVTTAVVEVPAATTLGGLFKGSNWHQQGIGSPAKGVLSGGLLGVFEAAGSDAPIASRGSLLVLDEATCVVALLTSLLSTLARQACGACAPGRIGVRALRGAFLDMARGTSSRATLARVAETAAHVGATARCDVGRRAGRLVASAMGAFPGEIEAHVLGRQCPAGLCPGLEMNCAE